MILFQEEYLEKWLSTEKKNNMRASILNSYLLKVVLYLFIAGIDFLEKSKETWLPLQYFDDSTFDDYPNKMWIEKKIDEDGNPRKLTGKGLKLKNA